MITKVQAALELVARSFLERHARYLIVTFNKKGQLVCFDIDAIDHGAGPCVFSPECATSSDYTWTSKKNAEKALTFVRKYFMDALQRKAVLPNWLLNERSIEMLTIIKIGTSAEAVPKQVRKSPGSGQDHLTTGRTRAAEVWPFSSAGPERAELEARLKKTKNPEMRAELQRQLAAFATDEEAE